jgi:putative ABC transport system permease protein
MSVIRYKIWHDIWENKSRTLQVVLIIAIGAFAIGSTMGAQSYISQDITGVWQKINPPMIGLGVDPAIDEAMRQSLEIFAGVETVEGRMEKGLKWRLSPDEAWRSTELVARQDYLDQKIGRVMLDSGEWPHRKSMAAGRGFGLKAGDTVYLEVEEKVYPVEISGVIYGATDQPAGFGGEPVFYATAGPLCRTDR